MKGWQGAAAVLGGVVIAGVMFNHPVSEAAPSQPALAAKAIPTDRVAGTCRELDDDTYVCVPTVAPWFGGVVDEIYEDGAATYSSGVTFDPETGQFD